MGRILPRVFRSREVRGVWALRSPATWWMTNCCSSFGVAGSTCAKRPGGPGPRRPGGCSEAPRGCEEVTDQQTGDQHLAQAHGAERPPRAREQPEGPGVERGVPVVVATVQDLLPLDERIVGDDSREKGQPVDAPRRERQGSVARPSPSHRAKRTPSRRSHQRGGTYTGTGRYRSSSFGPPACTGHAVERRPARHHAPEPLRRLFVPLPAMLTRISRLGYTTAPT